MSAADDIVVLTEYAEWREERSMGGAEDRLSVAVFVKEREDAANARRIEESLALVEGLIATREDQADDSDTLDGLRAIRDTLVDDRDVIEERTLTGPTIRRFV